MPRGHAGIKGGFDASVSDAVVRAGGLVMGLPALKVLECLAFVEYEVNAGVLFRRAVRPSGDDSWFLGTYESLVVGFVEERVRLISFVLVKPSVLLYEDVMDV